MTRRHGLLAVSMLCLFACCTEVCADFPSFRLPFKSVDADPRKAYWLQDQHGPWLIVAATFYSETGERQAHRLALELRSEYKLPAYVYKKKFDYGTTITGRGVDRYGNPKRMKYEHPSQFEEVAVLVGDFESYDDPKAQAALEKLKYARPQTLSATRDNPTSQRFMKWREIQKRISPNAEDRKKGPMGSSFVTRNPLLPKEYFVSKGPDRFILEINKDAQYSLLKCRGAYSVRVATFRGNSTWDKREMAKAMSSETPGGLAKAAENAHLLAAALRRKGVEAYEFHDRHESIVTIGSFAAVGTKRRDGKIEINPAVHRIMQEYGAKQQPGQGGALRPLVVKVSGIKMSFDYQALPVQVPRPSIGSSYENRNVSFQR